jgi:DNA-binding transcriptional ArsR family regulator
MIQSRQRSRPRACTRRGFALPLVILVTLVVSLGVGMLMQRSGAGYLAARRQADGYMQHHAGAGMREMVNRWLTTVRGRLKESIEEDGFAFSLDLPDGGEILVFLDDAQGSVLARPDAYTGRRREILESMNAYLDLLELQQQGLAARSAAAGAPGVPVAPQPFVSASTRPGEIPIELRRQYGPSEISLRTAPREVIEALASAICDPREVTRIADTIVSKRDDLAQNFGRPSGGRRSAAGEAAGGGGVREPTVDEVTRVLREMGVTDEQIKEFSSMLVYSPKLYRVTAELRDSGGRLLDKAGGLIELTEGRNDPFNQNGPFLTWENLPLEETRAR